MLKNISLRRLYGMGSFPIYLEDFATSRNINKTKESYLLAENR